ncbi:MAG: hypothetical protein Q9160_005556 [Pyrenula sp. 1 TL-2023]
MDRLQKFTADDGSQKYYDRDLDIHVINADFMDNCRNGYNILDRALKDMTYAYTQNTRPGKAEQITICKTYLQQMVDRTGPSAGPYMVDDNLKTRFRSWLSNDLWRAFGPGKPKIDALRLMDAMLVHEFTHVRQVANTPGGDEAYGTKSELPPPDHLPKPLLTVTRLASCHIPR